MTAIKEKVTKEVEEITKHKCDGCGVIREGKHLPSGWFNFSSGGYGSYPDENHWEDFDVCSVECFVKVGLYQLEHGEGYTEEIADMGFEFASKVFAALHKTLPNTETFALVE